MAGWLPFEWVSETELTGGVFIQEHSYSGPAPMGGRGRKWMGRGKAECDTGDWESTQPIRSVPLWARMARPLSPLPPSDVDV